MPFSHIYAISEKQGGYKILNIALNNQEDIVKNCEVWLLPGHNIRSAAKILIYRTVRGVLKVNVWGEIGKQEHLILQAPAHLHHSPFWKLSRIGIVYCVFIQ